MRSPERMRFRYQLEGYDTNWSEPTAARDATYTQIGPGSYRFRVIASNPDGVWNSEEASIGFRIAPLLWQTWWFRLSVASVCAIAILGLYRIRLHSLAAQLNLRFEERLEERNRIAHELHDTLLQGFLSASMQLDMALDQIPEDSPAKQPLGSVLETMKRVIDEGRNVVRGLRSSSGVFADLPEAFSRIRDEVALNDDVGFRVIVLGRARPLHPVLRDEVYRIGREALINAVRHSRAKNIEVELEYTDRQFRVLIRDNGCGMDSAVLRSGKHGRWGLPGMRERSERIGGRLHIWSSASAGTEVELSVPGLVAFESMSSSVLQRWFLKWNVRDGSPTPP